MQNESDPIEHDTAETQISNFRLLYAHVQQ